MKQSFPHKMMAKLVSALDPRLDRFRANPISTSKEREEKAREREEKKIQND